MEIQRKYELDIPPQSIGQGKTRHYNDGGLINDQLVKVIIELWGPQEAYIFYYDRDGNEMGDLMYESLERAVEHVEWEFGITIPRNEEEVDS